MFSFQGDSGGPLFIFNTATERYFQVGIVSGGVGECGTDRLPGVFTRVDNPEILDFININAGLQPTVTGKKFSRDVWPSPIQEHSLKVIFYKFLSEYA